MKRNYFLYLQLSLDLVFMKQIGNLGKQHLNYDKILKNYY